MQRVLVLGADSFIGRHIAFALRAAGYEVLAVARPIGRLRAMGFAALPLVTPVLGDGAQRFNPIHAADPAQMVETCLHTHPGAGPFEVGGPEHITQAGMLAAMRGWLGLAPARPQ